MTSLVRLSFEDKEAPRGKQDGLLKPTGAFEIEDARRAERDDCDRGKIRRSVRMPHDSIEAAVLVY